MPLPARRFGLLEWLITALSVLTLVAFLRPWWRLLGIFWDISVYERAVSDYSHGVDAYRRDVRFPFVYHPLVLRVFAQLDGLISLKVLFPALTLAAMVWLFVEFLRATGKPLVGEPTGVAAGDGIGSARVGLGLLAAAGFGGIGVPALMSGNLSPLMHFVLLAAFLRSRTAAGAFWRYLPYGLILMFALVKPYLLIYLAVPVLLYERKVIALACSALVLALFASIWLSFKAHWPAEYASFVGNLTWHVLSRGDIGYTFFYVFLNLTRKVPMALALHGVVSLLLTTLAELLFAQKYGRQVPFVPRLMVIYLVLTVANPRMKDYDLFAALAGFFTVLGLLSPRAAAITFAGLLPASVPVIVGLIAPDTVARHPQILDPFGNWQIIGLAVIGIWFFVEMHDAGGARQRTEPSLAAPSHEPPTAAS